MSQETYEVVRAPAATEEVDRLGNRIGHQLGGQVREFRMERRGSGVVLHGRARTYYAKQLAQHAVMRATVLPILRNEIEVS